MTELTKEILDEGARLAEISLPGYREQGLDLVKVPGIQSLIAWFCQNVGALIAAARERDTMRTLLREIEYEGGCDDLCPSCHSIKTPPWSTTKEPHKPDCILKRLIGEDDD